MCRPCGPCGTLFPMEPGLYVYEHTSLGSDPLYEVYLCDVLLGSSDGTAVEYIPSRVCTASCWMRVT